MKRVFWLNQRLSSARLMPVSTRLLWKLFPPLPDTESVKPYWQDPGAW